MTKRQFFALALILLLGAARLGAQQGSALQPVAGEELSGNRLVPSNEAFSIEAPAGWSWNRMMRPASGPLESRTYVAIDSKTGNSYTVTVLHDQSNSAVNDEYVQGLGDQLQGESARGTWRISEFRFEKSDIPVSGAYRYSCKATSRTTGETKRRYGYIVGAAVKYHFMCTAAEEKEPALFRRFVESFRDAS